MSSINMLHSVLKPFVVKFGMVLAIVLLLVCPESSYSAKTSISKYQQAQSELSKLKVLWAKKLTQASTIKQRNLILSKLGKLLSGRISKSMLPPWLGTPWAYHGTTVTPGKGAIACGYFVTTVLRDSGLKINRVRMARAASETMIRNVNQDSNIKRYRNKSIEHFVSEVKKWGEGLYIVGLDYHTGFILNRNNKIVFVHSSFYAPSKVVSELALTSVALKESHYRVLGKLFSDRKSVKRWLLN